VKKRVEIPYRYVPRAYQQPFWHAMKNQGATRAVLVWHRRAGKDTTVLNFTITEMVAHVGLYAYIFPEFSQGRRVLWEGIDRDGFRFRDYFHPDILARRKDGSPDMDEQEMRVRSANGSLFQIFGSDEYDRLRGLNIRGAVFTEYAYQDPRAWDVVRPILQENGGWAVFVYTPNGKNHGYHLLLAAKKLGWFHQVLTIEDTRAIPLSVLDEERALGADETFLQQEYYCSFDVGTRGAYYGDLMERAWNEGRVGEYPWIPELPVYTAWDLGRNDATAIWFLQVRDHRFYVIDYYEGTGQGLTHYAKVLATLPYRYGRHYMPHDINVTDWTTNTQRKLLAEQQGIRPITVVPKLPLEDGIEAVRSILPRCYFDQVKTEKGLRALTDYQKEYDEDRRTFKKTPLHNWASNGADAFRTFAVGYQPTPTRPPAVTAETAYNVFTRARLAPQESVPLDQVVPPQVIR